MWVADAQNKQRLSKSGLAAFWGEGITGEGTSEPARVASRSEQAALGGQSCRHFSDHHQVKGFPPHGSTAWY